MDGIDGSKTTAEDASIPGPTVRVLNPPHNTPKPREDSSDRPTARGSAVRKLLVPTPSPITGRGRLYQATMTPPRIFVFFVLFFSPHTFTLPATPAADAFERCIQTESSGRQDANSNQPPLSFPNRARWLRRQRAGRIVIKTADRTSGAAEALKKPGEQSSMLCLGGAPPRPDPIRGKEKLADSLV